MKLGLPRLVNHPHATAAKLGKDFIAWNHWPKRIHGDCRIWLRIFRRRSQVIPNAVRHSLKAL